MSDIMLAWYTSVGFSAWVWVRSAKELGDIDSIQKVPEHPFFVKLTHGLGYSKEIHGNEIMIFERG